MREVVQAMDPMFIVTEAAALRSDAKSFMGGAHRLIDKEAPGLKTFIHCVSMLVGPSAVVGASFIVELLRRRGETHQQAKEWLTIALRGAMDEFCAEQALVVLKDPAAYQVEMMTLIDAHSPALKEMLRKFAEAYGVEAMLGAVIVMELLNRANSEVMVRVH
jgi:hypothetical protein